MSALARAIGDKGKVYAVDIQKEMIAILDKRLKQEKIKNVTLVHNTVKDPKLLARRMRGGPTAEKLTAQKIIMSIVSVGFIALLVVPALDHRFAWSHTPASVALAGDALMAIGWLAIFFVFRENSFSSATIEIVDDQRVVSTGPYAWVRHPMYAGALLMLLGMPLALGSWWGVLAFLAMLPALIWRVFDEEKLLTENLAGYAEYRQKVRFRLIPGVW